MAFGTSGHRGSSLRTSFNEDHIARHHPGHLRVPGRPGHRRAAVPRHRQPRAVRARQPGPRWRCWPPTASRCWSTSRAATRRPRRSRTPSSPTTATAPSGLADGIVVTPVAQPSRRRRVQVQPAQRRTGRHRRHPLDRRTGPTSCWPPGCAGVERIPYERARGRRHHRHVRLSRPRTAPISRRRRPRRHPRRPASRSGPTRWAGRASPTGRRSPTVHKLDLTVVNPARRPDLRVHDPGLGRQDPHGLLVALRHGVAHRAARPVHSRHRQRRRRRPARHRHPRRRPDEPQPLPGRRHPVPVRESRPAGRPAPPSARRWSAAP